jgi:hypothetical protein
MFNQHTTSEYAVAPIFGGRWTVGLETWGWDRRGERDWRFEAFGPTYPTEEKARHEADRLNGEAYVADVQARAA